MKESAEEIKSNIINSPELFVEGEHLAKYGENCCKEASWIYNKYTGISKIYKKTASAARQYLRAAESVEKYINKSGMKAENIVPEEFLWLTDNAYLVKEEKNNIRYEIKGKIRLPDSGKNIPCVYRLAEGFFRSGCDSLSSERLRVYLSGVQTERRLRENELWAFIGMLKCAALISVSETAEKILRVVREYNTEGSLFEAEYQSGKELLSSSGGEESSRKKREKAAAVHNILTEHLKNAISALRALREIDYSDILSQASILNQTLEKDPTGAYGASDKRTKAHYRIKTERIARISGEDEYKTAKRLIDSAGLEKDEIKRSVCWQIDNDPYITNKKRRRAAAVAAADLVIPLIVSLLICIIAGNAFLFLLIILPVSEFTKGIISYIVLSNTPGEHIPRFDLEDGVPEDGMTVVAVSVLITAKTQAAEIFSQLERYRLSNRECGDNVVYGILADLKDCENPESDTDKDIMQELTLRCDELNQKYGNHFCVFTRKRSYYRRERMYFGHERKRGAIGALAAMICSDESELELYGSEKERIQKIKYILALDADSMPTPDSVRYIIGCAMHPVNRAVLDETGSCVRSGYGIFQMKISVDLEAADASEFARIYAGQGGTDPYSGPASDIYQDIYGEGIFTGKGLIDARIMHACMKDAIPDGRILSHDLLEGSYLRTALVSEAEMTDGFPAKTLSYFKRYARWVRGDVQLLPWLGGQVKNRQGKKVCNPINRLSKYKICDNLRRVLTPMAQFLSFLLYFITLEPLFGIAAAASLISMTVPLIVNGCIRVKHIGQRPATKGRATIYAGLGGGLILAFSRFLMLPYEAYISLRAAVTSLYRMYISEKNLLEWVTAAESEKTAVNGVWSYYCKMLPCVAAGAIAAALGLNAAAFTFAIFWALAPLYACCISKRTEYTERLNVADREYLREKAGEMWKYFEDNCVAKNNFLPPDNYQEQPLNSISNVTSPTNIGFALMSAVAADELGICSGLTIIRDIIRTLNRMEKNGGLFYNWYNVQTLSPMPPKTVSSVDCGNLAASLLVTAEYLKKKDNTECICAVRDAERLYREMDFSRLYNSKRHLFKITLDIENSCYDMLASESRLMSYIAISKGDVPKNHWEYLSRQMVKKNGNSGLASWGGSLFEYLMPDIYMPDYKNSLIFESTRYAVFCQSLRSEPWGISESGYYAFDRELKYQYKGHGVSSAGLKNGLDKELVISPYSSFLAILSEPETAIKNIYALEKIYPKGKYGLYEAYDYTECRIPENEEYMPVRSFMAHHMGMSICAAANCLTRDRFGRGALQRLFMDFPETDAYRQLLTERIPLRKRTIKICPEPTKNEYEPIRYDIRFRQDLPEEKYGNICANRGYSVLTGATGYNEAICSGYTPYRSDPDITQGLPGIIALIKDADGIFSPCAAMSAAEKQQTAEFTESYSRYTVLRRQIEIQYTLAVPENDSAELRELTFINGGKNDEYYTVCIYLEPILSPKEDYESHPDYSRMMIYTSAIQNGAQAVRRDKLGNDSVVMSVITDAQDAKITTSREAMRRMSYDNPDAFFTDEASGEFGEVRDSCIRLIIKVRVPTGKSKTFRVAAASGRNRRETEMSARRALLTPKDKFGRLLAQTAEKLGLDESAAAAALTLLPHMIYPSGTETKDYQPNKAGLWSVGISGERPLILAEGGENIARSVAVYRLLRECGVKAELAVLTDDRGSYDRREYSAYQTALRYAGREFAEEIVTAEKSAIDDYVRKAVYSEAAFTLPYRKTLSGFPALKTRIRHATNGKRSLPARINSQPLANRYFGVMTSDCGLSHLWCGNSRLNRLTPWENDPLAAYMRGIKLEYCLDGDNVSLFASDDGYSAAVSFEPGVTVWTKTIANTDFTVRAYVDRTEPLLNIEISAVRETPGEVVLYIKPVIGERERENRTVVCRYSDGILTAFNAANGEFAAERISLSALPEIKKYTCSTGAYYENRFDNSDARTAVPCLAAAVKFEGGRILFSLSAGNAKYSPIKKEAEPQTEYDSLRIKTPWPELDGYINGFSARQIKLSRLYARTSVYQNGGAYGFRDQLQDAASLLMTEPDILRNQIIRASCHQYAEGDVQHWWHPGRKASPYESLGVRTTCSDDLLWLIWAVCEYTGETGDMTLLGLRTPFLRSEPLAAWEGERYEKAAHAEEKGSISEHCRRAAEKFISRGRGTHGLPLILGGDWNDGMNRVGSDGRGESVWLAHFGADVMSRFGALIGEERFTRYALELRGAADAAYEDGRYLRGYDDAGNKIGAAGNAECAVDSISQSFAAFSDPESGLARAGIRTALDALVDRQNMVVRLFTPPFTSKSGAGYIAAYPPGVRENGGQYTHGAVWLAAACFRSGYVSEGLEIMLMLLPQRHDPAVYKGESYVLAADVYSEGKLAGMCGWSWYTGAAGWYRRTVLRDMLGIAFEGGKLSVSPKITEDFECSFERLGIRYRISSKNGEVKTTEESI